MNVSELYFRTQVSLDVLALHIAERLGVICQRREGMNKGGIYYRYKAFGMTLELLSNTGEVEMPGRSDWQFYVMLYCEEYPMTKAALQCMGDHLRELLANPAVEVDVDVR